jgi:hypothetical protein
MSICLRGSTFYANFTCMAQWVNCIREKSSEDEALSLVDQTKKI